MALGHRPRRRRAQAPHAQSHRQRARRGAAGSSRKRGACTVAGRRRRAARGTRGGRLLVHATLARRRHRDLERRDRGARRRSKQAYRRLRGLPGFARARRRAVARSARPPQRAPRRRWPLRPRRTRASASCRVRTRPRIACSAISGCAARASRRTPSSAMRRSCSRSAPRRCRRQTPPPPPTSPSSPATITPRSSVRCGSPASRSTGTWSFARSAVVSIDAQRQALRTPFGAAAGDGARRRAAEAHGARASSTRRASWPIEGEGTAGEFELSLIVQHAAAGELLVTLTAPSGAEAALTVPRSDGARVETFAFQAAQGSPLAQLADEGVRGVWRLTIVDRAAGNTGVFGGWGLSFGDNVGARRSVRAARDSRSAARRGGRACRQWPIAPSRGRLRPASSAPSRCGISRPGSSSTTTRCRPPRGKSRSTRPARACWPRPIGC